jgi:hypothetical protein
MKIWLKVILKDEIARAVLASVGAVLLAAVVAYMAHAYKVQHPAFLEGFGAVFTAIVVFGLVIAGCAVLAFVTMMISMWAHVLDVKVQRETEDHARHAAHSGRLTEYSATAAREGDISTPEPAPKLPPIKARSLYIEPAPEAAVVARASGYETPGFAHHIQDAEGAAAHKASLRAKLASAHSKGHYHDPDELEVELK